MPDNKIELLPSENGGAVVLPYGLDEFGKFIAGLLGKPQAILKEFHAPFEVSKESIRNIDALLSQRVSSQNKGTLAQFIAHVFYDDDTSVVTNGLADFLAYNEARAVVSTKATFTWVFLIQFEGRLSPERETIELHFSTARSLVSPFLFRLFETPERKPKVKLSITHTNRTWGEDIESMMTRALSQHERKLHWSRRLLNKNANLIFALTGAGLICLSLMIANWWDGATREALEIRAASLSTELDYLKFLADRSLDPSDSSTPFAQLAGLLAFIGTPVTAILFYSIAAMERPSFLTFTDAAQEKKAASDKSLKHTWGQVLMGAVLSIIVGFIGKFLYDYALGT